MTPEIKARLERARDRMAEEMGNRHACPVIRSMYPSRSRGEMSREFSQLYSLGFDAAVEMLWPMIEASIFLSKEARGLAWAHRYAIEADGGNSNLACLERRGVAFEQALANIGEKE